MLNKNDLVKQFELVVKQEIINHNNQILMTNQSLNEMREFQQEQEKKQSQMNGKFSEGLSKIANNCHENEKEIKNLYYKIDNKFNDFFLLISKLTIVVDSYNQMHIELKTLVDDLDKKVNDLELKIYRLDKIFSKFVSSLAEYETKLLHKTDEKVFKLKEEINSKPSEALFEKDELLKIINIYRVDSIGIKEWIKKVHQCNFINEKKIENIYTLIDRLNKKIG
jgi:hypothetical protein